MAGAVSGRELQREWCSDCCVGEAAGMHPLRSLCLQDPATSADSLWFDIGFEKHLCSSALRFHSMHADLNPVSFACSQLQNYDPERALTDYIHRLEALQRRLGSVQSGMGWGTVPSTNARAGAEMCTDVFGLGHFQP